MGSPIGTHYILTGFVPLGHSHVGPNWDPSLFFLGYNLVIPTCAFPCWSQLGPIFIFSWVQPGYSHLGIPMLVPIGTHISFRMGYTWALPLGHSHVGPNWDPHLFSYGIHLVTPIWAFLCWSQFGPTSFFTWDTPGYTYFGIPMVIPHGTHIFFHVGYTWALTLGHSHVGPKWGPYLFSLSIVFYLAPRMFPSGHSCCHSKWFSANRNEKIRGIYML